MQTKLTPRRPLPVSNTSRLLLLTVVAMLFCGSSVAEEEEEDEYNINVETTTAVNSAGIARRLREGPDISQEEVDRDYKRTAIGIGERVTLTVNDKNLGDPQLLQWELEEGSQYVQLPPEAEGESIKVDALHDIKEEGEAVIIVTAENGRKGKVTLTVKVPNQFEGRHKKGQGGESGMPAEGAPMDEGWVGASAQLEVFLGPRHLLRASVFRCQTGRWVL